MTPTQDDAPVTVVKVGGSLLDWPELPERLAAFLETLRPRPIALVVGGGGFADVVRRLDRVHRLGEARAHHLALRSVDLSAHLVALLLPGLQVVDSLGSVAEQWGAGLTPVVSPRLIMEEDERGTTDPLPQSWGTTTDSIAARVAGRLGAAELVLLKSASPGGPLDRGQAARVGYVDPVFPAASAPLPKVMAVNLRAVPWQEFELTP